MENQKLLVSVVITTLNRKSLLKEALLDLNKQRLDKNLFEVIVVNDGSTDGTDESLTQLTPLLNFNLRVFRQNNRGPSSARNLGIENAQSGIIAFHDDDTTVCPGWLENALSYFKDDSVFGIEGKTEIKETIKPFTHYVANEHGGIFLGCNIFYRKSILDKLGGFDQNIRRAFGDDYDVALRVLALGGKIPFCKDVVAIHKILPIKAKTIIKKAAFSQDIPYLFKKHGEKIRPFLGFRIQRVFISVFFLFFLYSLVKANHLVSVISLSCMVLITMYLEKKYLKTKSILLFLKALVVYMTADIFTFPMFLYGCLKHKVMPSAKMFKR